MNHPSYQGTAKDANLLDKLFALLLYLLPHHLLSQAMYWLTRIEWAPLKDLLIAGAIKLYKIDMQLAVEQDPTRYPSFNAFFTRALRPDARPLDERDDTVLSPVDGAISQIGRIQDGRIFQAKGQSYTLSELLGADEAWCKQFDEGHFATIYLSPRDYHRIHMPLSGILQKMLHIPGRLFSVSPSTTRVVPRLFSRNERLVNLFETDKGPMAVIMVGAIFVASMDTVWAGTVAPTSRRINQWHYGPVNPTASVALDRGEEMGRFNMGSTVVLLFAKDTIEWSDELTADCKVEMGQQIATLKE
ncbi:archaetidylserine decarboxylase [Sedimenticola selenatireducens]|uniref:Phosphatidylserine decarboxylase proenzyme n=1 Tax=Sedimenticola selenatireducens TaxID=191960 RepID=A0A558DZJ0_9GAMM|nr:archaetidylserine decarboxylase [Sedimenticola selenatireducens]TVO68572.1 phosphatidylserine decarboxylase [Sedimenticola selenatireducens]TVT66512.1 MAG: phosphatidylserine decarboxylase [Sedimenticola selenatireducens]